MKKDANTATCSPNLGASVAETYTGLGAFRHTDTLFKPDVFKQALAWVEAQPMRYGWYSSKTAGYAHWNADFLNGAVSNEMDLDCKLPVQLRPLWEPIKAAMNDLFGYNAKLTRCYLNGYTYGTEGYIHEDNDDDGDLTAVVYMNAEWDMNWGGETLFYPDGLPVFGLLPAPGRVAIFNARMLHRAAPLSRWCPTLRRTLVIKTKRNIPGHLADPEAGKLYDFVHRSGAFTRPHKNGSLGDHLMRCYYLVRSAGLPIPLAYAAGLHSAYGTNAYKTGVLSDDKRDIIRHHFGDWVEHLVYLFHCINRPEVLERPNGSLTSSELEALRIIECANLYDQGVLETWPQLYEFARQFIERARRV